MEAVAQLVALRVDADADGKAGRSAWSCSEQRSPTGCQAAWGRRGRGNRWNCRAAAPRGQGRRRGGRNGRHRRWRPRGHGRRIARFGIGGGEDGIVAVRAHRRGSMVTRGMSRRSSRPAGVRGRGCRPRPWRRRGEAVRDAVLVDRDERDGARAARIAQPGGDARLRQAETAVCPRPRLDQFAVGGRRGRLRRGGRAIPCPAPCRWAGCARLRTRGGRRPAP